MDAAVERVGTHLQRVLNKVTRCTQPQPPTLATPATYTNAGYLS